MIKNLKHFIILFFFTILIETTVSAKEYFCLEDEGFIYPLFEETNCDNTQDEKITKEEFINIFNINQKDRKIKLTEFRKNIEEGTQEVKTEKDIEVADVIKIKKESIKKIEFNKRKQKQLAKIEERKILQKQKKLKNLAKIEERKKLKEQKKQARLAKIEEGKKLKEQKKQARLTKIEEGNKLKEQKKINLTKKEKKENIEEDIVVNKNLKVVFFNKKIVNNNLTPYIDGEVSILESLNKQDFKNLIAANSNLTLIIPKDLEAFSNNISQSQMTSRVVTGIRQVPNPDYRRLEMEIRDKERKAMLAKRESEIYEYKLQTQQSSGVGWLDVLGAFANTGASISYYNKYQNLQNELTSLINDYSNTPLYLDQEIFSPYNYDVVNIKAEKKVHYNIIQYKEETFYNNSISISENKIFNVAYNIQTQDKNYEELSNKFDVMANVKNWENKKIEKLNVNSLLAKLDDTKKIKIEGINKVYTLLDFEQDEEKSWWKKIFNFDNKKERKKTSSLTDKSSYETKDERFESVVVVRTGSGLGSGFFISKDEILTNYHVIEGAMSISIIDKNKKRSSAVVIKQDLKRDLALLKTNMKGKPVTFYTGSLKQGEMVEALGHPKGKRWSLTKGWISAIRKESSTYNSSGSENVLFIQTDAAINHGNSGGPLFFKDKVVGVNTQGLSKEISEGMNFAVHFSEVKKFLEN